MVIKKLWKSGPVTVYRPTDKWDGNKFQIDIDTGAVEFYRDTGVINLHLTEKQLLRLFEAVSVAEFFVRHGAIPSKPSKKQIEEIRELIKNAKGKEINV